MFVIVLLDLLECLATRNDVQEIVLATENANNQRANASAILDGEVKTAVAKRVTTTALRAVIVMKRVFASVSLVTQAITAV